jgi:hypothetical protein
MQWTADVSAGEWLGERLDDGPGWGSSMHGVVPHGFAAYARIFHRPTVGWVEGRPFPTQDELRETPFDRWPETLSADTTWAETAVAFGTEMHGTAQWNRIVRRADTAPGDPHDGQSVIGPDGREYNAPQEGALDAEQLAATAHHLADATSTPDDVYVALWEGWGGVLGFFGENPASVVLTAGGDPGIEAHHRAMLERSIHDPFNNVFRKPTWQSGILSDEISQGARLRLPDRDHVLFRAEIAELTDPTWAQRVPWREENPDVRGQSPSVIWPADHAWVLVTEVDYDSTIVGGTAGLIRAICADPSVEALPVREGADLSWDADEVNR